jgi:hypothetical protein
MSEEKKAEKTQVQILRDAFEGMKGRQLQERALLSRRGIAVLATSLVTVGLGSVPIQVAHAASGEVQCKVQELIETIKSAISGDVLSLAEGCIYTLTDSYPPRDPNLGDNGLPIITIKLTIEGNGATITRAQSAPKFRIFEVGQGGDLTLSHLTVDNGVTSGVGPKAGRGGGIYNLGTLKVINSTLSHNHASFGGGGIGNGDPTEVTPPPPRAAGDLTLSDSVLFDNSSDIVGGAIANGVTSTMSLIGCTISHNIGGTDGGGLASQGTVFLEKCTISGNSGGFGGGIVSAGQLFLTDSPVTGNTATGCVNSVTGCDPTQTGFGGGIVNLGGRLFLTDSPVTGNTATNGGGIVSLGQLFLTDNAVTGNSATAVTGISLSGFGGGILNEPDSAATLTNSDVTGNSATSDGAGIANDGHMTLTHSNITGNAATHDGGGIANLHVPGTTAATLTLTNSDVTGNSAGQGQHGGGIFNQPGNPVTLNHSTVAGNTPDDFSDVESSASPRMPNALLKLH